jgi:hypothetical protein
LLWIGSLCASHETLLVSFPINEVVLLFVSLEGNFRLTIYGCWEAKKLRRFQNLFLMRRTEPIYNPKLACGVGEVLCVGGGVGGGNSQSYIMGGIWAALGAVAGVAGDTLLWRNLWR